jgi:hypothetical protein
MRSKLASFVKELEVWCDGYQLICELNRYELSFPKFLKWINWREVRRHKTVMLNLEPIMHAIGGDP